jgi:hypothetical protein
MIILTHRHVAALEAGEMVCGGDYDHIDAN